MRCLGRTRPLLIIVLPVVLLAQGDLPGLVKQIQRSVVTIVVSQGRTYQQGTGFFVSPDLLVTNSHVIEAHGQMSARKMDGEPISIDSVLLDDPARDLAILKTKRLGQPLQLAPALPAVGEQVFVIGSPLGLDQTVTDGIVSAVRELSEGRILQITAAISHGSSGSPVINTKGLVVGVATFKLREGESLNFAIPARYVGDMLARAHRAPEQSSDSPPPSQTVLRRKDPFIAGMELVISQDYAGALPFLELAAAKQQSDHSLWFYIALCQSNLRRYREAADAYNVSLKIKPDNSEAWYNLGLVLSDLNRRDEALAAYEQAVRYQPAFAEAYLALGRIRLTRKEHASAEQAFRQAISANFSLATAYTSLAELYESQGKLAEELLIYQECIKHNPTFSRAYYSLAITYLKNGDRASALQNYVILKSLDAALAERLYRDIYR